jgi:translation initiation factor IF-1
MARESIIEVEGAIVEVLPNKMYRVELANGHRVLAYVTGRARLSFAHLAAGARVRLDMSLYDLSAGRIILETQTI